MPRRNRVRKRVRAAVAVATLGCWLLLALAEAHEPLHRWLHNGTIPKDDACAVTLLATGKAKVSEPGVEVIPVLTAAVAPIVCSVPALVAKLPLPPGRGPPPLSVAS